MIRDQSDDALQAAETTRFGSDNPRTAESKRSEPRANVMVRLFFALAISGAVSSVGADRLGRTLKGPATIIGYPIYADFDPNHYLVVFYFAVIVFPLLGLALYHLLSKIGPLRRTSAPRRAVREGPAPSLLGGTDPVAGLLGQAGTSFIVGGVVGLEVAVVVSAVGGSVLELALGGGGCFTALTLLRHLMVERRSARRDVATLQLLGLLAILPLLSVISGRTTVTVTPGPKVVHYPFFPWWLSIAVVLIGLGVATWRVRRGLDTAAVARALATYLAVPIALFLTLSALPGALGPMDSFTEGEYLGGSFLMLHGYLPWKDLYLIHGVLDDGLKPLVGFGLFGMTRWGATAGITFIWIPAYWIATYLFSASVFGRRWSAAAATALAVSLGVFVDWDVRYLLWPLVLALFALVLRRRRGRDAAILGAALILQSLLVPEMLYGLPAVGIALIGFELYERADRRPSWRDLRLTLTATGAALIVSGGFFVWLAVIGGVSGFFGYFSDFASAHSLSGGIPLFTNYAVRGSKDVLGVLHYNVQHLGWLSRFPLELVIPVAALLATFALFCVQVRRGRRLTIEDWVTLAAAIMAGLYYPKGLSRADAGHIGESFAMTVPLLICLAARLIIVCDGVVRRWLSERATRTERSVGRLPRWSAAIGSPVGAALVVVLLLVASSPVDALEGAPAHVHSAAPAAPAPVVAGAGGLGYEEGALPDGLVSDMAALIRTYAGPSRTVFDFTNSPAIFDFLLETPPASRFYDINLTITEAAQQQAVRDLERSKPAMVVFASQVGLYSWDYIQNDVRDHIVSDYLLDHYRPLVLVDHELVLVSDSMQHQAPLPHLVGKPVTGNLYFSQAACGFGYAPNFLPPPNESAAVTVPITPVTVQPALGIVYRVTLPPVATNFRYLVANRSNASSAASLAVSNFQRRSRHDISWVDAAGTSSTAVEVGACLQWHGFGDTVYVRYKGPGTLTSVSLVR